MPIFCSLLHWIADEPIWPDTLRFLHFASFSHKYLFNYRFIVLLILISLNNVFFFIRADKGNGMLFFFLIPTCTIFKLKKIKKGKTRKDRKREERVKQPSPAKKLEFEDFLIFEWKYTVRKTNKIFHNSLRLVSYLSLQSFNTQSIMVQALKAVKLLIALMSLVATDNRFNKYFGTAELKNFVKTKNYLFV